MSDITVTLPEDEAREYVDRTKAHGGPIATLRQKIRAALPPEYAEGTVAWVTLESTLAPQLRVLRNGLWSMNSEGATGVASPAKVEPLRILADDEIAVKRTSTPVSAAWIRRTAKSARLAHNYVGADALDRYADALDAEKK